MDSNMTEFDVMSEERYTWKILLMRVTAVLCMLTSIFGAYFSVFGLGISLYRIICAGLLSALISAFVCRKGRYLWIRWGIVFCIAGGCIYYFRDRVLGGLASYVNPYVVKLNAFYLSNFPEIAAKPDVHGACLIMLCLMLLFAAIFCVVLEKKAGKLAAVFVLFLPIMILAVIGEMPSLFWCWCMMISIAVYLIVTHTSSYRYPIKEFIVAAIVLIILWISSAVFTPMVHIYKKDHIKEYKEIKSVIIDAQQIDWKELSGYFVPEDAKFGGGDDMDGQLKNLTSFYHSGKVIKEVIVEEKPEKAVYHREFIGAYYTGDAWIPPENDDFSFDLYIDGYEDKNLDQLKWMGQSMVQNSPEQVATMINVLCSAENGFRYEQYPGKMPEDRGFVEGFLFVKQEGFCVHFATAATMIYRVCGWPARYVEGYRIEPEEFKAQVDGTYKAVVTDYMGHAWCETYEGSSGWRVREHTIADVEEIVTKPTQAPQNTEQQQGNNTQDQQAGGTAVPQEDPWADLPPGLSAIYKPREDMSSYSFSGGADIADKVNLYGIIDKYGVIGSVLLILLWPTCILGALVFVVRLWHRLCRSRKRASFQIRKGNRGILNIYNEIMDMCEYASKKGKYTSLDSYKMNPLTEREYAEHLAEHFTALTQEEWMWIYDCAQRAAYGADLLPKEERKEMYCLYQKLRDAILRELPKNAKRWFLYGRGM